MERKIEKKFIDVYTVILKAVSNPTRLNILYSLYEKPKTWTELIFELEVNPKSLRDHLVFLRKARLVKKGKSKGFELTTAGKTFIELSLKDVISTIKKAAELTEEKQKLRRNKNAG
jgi:predicted transcriptional regulator